MATSPFKTTSYTSRDFTESAGTVLFDPSTNKICLLHLKAKNEWLLPKGRRNIGESRAEAALRETREETGFDCRLLPVSLESRQPRVSDDVDVEDEVRMVEGVSDEAFMVTVREVGEGRVKVIWWYVGMLDDEGGHGNAEEGFEAMWFGAGEVVERATFESDRRVLTAAVRVYRRTMTSAA